jgi:hypothetical protein
MSLPYTTEELEREIYTLVISSHASEGDPFPTTYVWLHMSEKGYTKDDYMSGVDSLMEKGLITEDEIIADNFFEALSKPD